MTTDNTLDPAIVEKAAKAIGPESCTCLEGHNQHGYWRRIEMSCPSCGDSEAKARAVLEAVEADIKAEALREAAEAVRIYAWQPGDGSPPPKGHAAAYMHGANDAHNVCDRLLRTRADALAETSAS